MSTTTTTIADHVHALAHIVEAIEALGVEIASAQWARYGDKPLNIQVCGFEATVDIVAEALGLDPDAGTSANYVRSGRRVTVYASRDRAVCTCRATCHHMAVTA